MSGERRSENRKLGDYTIINRLLLSSTEDGPIRISQRADTDDSLILFAQSDNIGRRHFETVDIVGEDLALARKTYVPSEDLRWLISKRYIVRSVQRTSNKESG